MKTLLKIGGVIGLLLTVLSPILYFTETITLEVNHQLMLTGMLIWYVTAILNNFNKTQ